MKIFKKQENTPSISEQMRQIELLYVKAQEAETEEERESIQRKMQEIAQQIIAQGREKLIKTLKVAALVALIFLIAAGALYVYSSSVAESDSLEEAKEES